MDLQLWNSIVKPQLSLIDKKWAKILPFWELAVDTFPEEMKKLEKLEQLAWQSFKSKESTMTLRLKVTAYFDLLNKTCEMASKNESWRSPRISREPDGSLPF